MSELKKVLSYRVLLLIVINSIMGTGIFFVPAVGAEIAGPASIISWVLMSAVAIYISMCFGELTSMFPSAGGVYEFSKQAFGRVTSFLLGWLTLIVGNITIAMLIIGAISYLLPPKLPQLQVTIMIISAVFILLFNIVAYKGMKTSATMLVTFSFITLGTLAALIIPSIFTFQVSNLTPFFDKEWPFVFLAIFFIAETFFGWESPTFLAGETKEGHKVVPKAIFHGTLIICAISLVFVLFSMGSLGWTNLATSEAPLADLANVHYGDLGRSIFAILVYLAIIGSVADWVVSAPRLVLSMAKDKLFPVQFAKINEKYGTPGRAIILQAVLSILFVFLGLGSYETLLYMLIPLLLLMYSFIMVAVVVLRYKQPNTKRYFTVPFGKVGPLIIVACFMGLLATWLFLTPNSFNLLFKGLLLIAMGLPVYFLLEMYYNPNAIRIVDDVLAYFTLWTERISLPLGVRKEIIRLMGNIKGKTVLEFGCSVGTFTLHLAEEVGPTGKVWATDISKRETRITQKRMEKKGHNHVIVLHDEQHASRVHPDVPKIHSIVSVGMLGYLQNAKKVLKEMNKRLKKGSKICFVEYDKFFDFIPNVEWLGDDMKIKGLFGDSGFKVSVIRKQGFAWKYIFIYGIKDNDKR